MSYLQHRSFIGRVTRMHLGMRQAPHALYISLAELQEIARSSPKYHRLFEQWVSSGYKRSLAPSIDRIDHTQGYRADNIQFITQSENARKGCWEHPSRIRKAWVKHRKPTCLVGNHGIQRFKSRTEAAQYIDVPVGQVLCAVQKGHRCRGWLVKDSKEVKP